MALLSTGFNSCFVLQAAESTLKVSPLKAYSPRIGLTLDAQSWHCRMRNHGNGHPSSASQCIFWTSHTGACIVQALLEVEDLSAVGPDALFAPRTPIPYFTMS